jgi:hypothetical protein
MPELQIVFLALDVIKYASNTAGEAFNFNEKMLTKKKFFFFFFHYIVDFRISLNITTVLFLAFYEQVLRCDPTLK